MTTSLEEILQAAVRRFNALTPEQQKEMRRAQQKSWVVGEMMLEHPDMSREEAEKLYNKVCF
jgi:hypothetical protein